ncbi:FtsB family cell division protein [Halodurantibacterium flavum]|uniref:Septum formation initiator family protein n=1 Tax=Halodurantibacterium flavum TaxID=1382802 RepID=A0ABW4S3D9_9RHOB
MGRQRGGGPGFGPVMYYGLAFSLASYFTFAAVQGDYGVFRRVQIDAETRALQAERDALAAELAEMENKTRRLSDDFLDLDLLDEQARDVLGLIRMDELVVR